MKKFLSAADILKAPDKTEQKEIKSVGGVVNVKRLSPADNEKLSDFYVSHTEGENIRYNRIDFQALLISLAVVGEDGKTPIFTAEDLAQLRQKDADLWAEIWAAVESTNPIGKKEEVDAAKKNS